MTAQTPARADPKAARLAKALRDNLRRRKAASAPARDLDPDRDLDRDKDDPTDE